MCFVATHDGVIKLTLFLLKTSIKYLISIMLLFFCPYIWLVRGLGVYSYFVMALSVGALGLFITHLLFLCHSYVDLDFVGKETEESSLSYGALLGEG